MKNVTLRNSKLSTILLGEQKTAFEEIVLHHYDHDIAISRDGLHIRSSAIVTLMIHYPKMLKTLSQTFSMHQFVTFYFWT